MPTVATWPVAKVLTFAEADALFDELFALAVGDAERSARLEDAWCDPRAFYAFHLSDESDLPFDALYCSAAFVELVAALRSKREPAHA